MGAPLEVKELYERYGRAVFRRCQYFLRERGLAEDAMHDVFVKVIEAQDDFQSQSSPLTWIVRITTNHCLNLVRASRAGWRGRYEETVKVDAQQGYGAGGELERAELVRALLGKVERAAEEAAVYYFVDEMTQQDAAAACGCSVPTLRKRLRQFVKAARRELKRQDASLVFGEEPI